MKLSTFNLFKKFMMMTTSTNEHEAIGAMKAANSLLVREGLTWDRVLDRSLKVIQEVEAAPESYEEERPVKAARTTHSEDDDLMDAFAAIADMKDSTFKKTCEDIHEQYLAKGWLSPAQRALIMRAHDNRR